MSLPDTRRLSKDCRALLKLIDRLTGPDLEFTSCQFDLWSNTTEDEPHPVQICLRRQQVIDYDTPGGPTANWQLTGDVVRWDFEVENWAYRKPLFRFLTAAELHAWLRERYG